MTPLGGEQERLNSPHREFVHRLFADEPDVGLLFVKEVGEGGGADVEGSGVDAEGGHDDAAWVNDKALATCCDAALDDGGARVQVACDFGRFEFAGWFVAQGDGAELVFSEADAAEALRGMGIVIATDPDGFDFGGDGLQVGSVWFGQLLMGDAVVKRIAEQNETPGFGGRYHLLEQRESDTGIERRNLNSAARKACTVFEMKISNKQRLEVRRVQSARVIRQESDARQFEFVHLRQDVCF
jgi:hypothetical protein